MYYRGKIMNQIDLHKQIDKVLSKSTKSFLLEKITKLVGVNDDARQYYFHKADEKWLEWLWKNGFLESIKHKTSDTDSYSYRMPELQYLVKVAELKPDLVTKIICSFEISSDNYNPEVVDQFTRIASKLPARCLKKIVKKIRDEKWVELMGKYTQYGYEYADMLKTLVEAKDYVSTLTLAQAILQVRSKSELDERKSRYASDNIFYINDISETKVFTLLVDIPDQYIEKALALVVNSFTQAIKGQGSGYILLDEDFFTLTLGSVSSHEYREEQKYLAATIVELTKRAFNNTSLNKKSIYKKYFSILPDNQVARRLALFVLSIDPQLFIKELETEYFKLFTVSNTRDVLNGAEYEQALKAGFSCLSDTKQRSYVSKVFSLFGQGKNEEDKRWDRHYANSILSSITKSLTEEELTLAKERGYQINPNYVPEPSIGKISGGTVTSRSPIDLAEYPVVEIAEKLKGELSPDELKKRYSSDDFRNPRDADGVAEQLKTDIKNRLSDYLEHATLFFDREQLIPHYTNAFLRGITDALSEKRSDQHQYDYNELFKLLTSIQNSGEGKSFSRNEKDTEGRWLSNWNSVHATIANLIEELIKKKDNIVFINFKQYRARVFSTLAYLFTYDDPIPEDEKLKTARMTVKPSNETEYSISDPFSIAINSVRGQAFQTFLHFVYQDASTDERIKLADDAKNLYDRLLKNENTRAIMFMFGHYLPSFYFRDVEWTRSKFSEIFESKSKDKYLHLAAWEGHLSSNLYKELFNEPFFQGLYKNNITATLTYPKQKFFEDPHKSLAIHLALAFVHYEDFGFENTLFQVFIEKASTKQFSEFISFLGRSYIAGDNLNILKDSNNSWRVQRVQEFWAWMLEHKADSQALKEFGTWIKAGSEVFEIKWLSAKVAETLKVTGGELEWEYGLVKSIEKIAIEAPHEAMNLLKNRFLLAIENKERTFYIREDKEWYNAFDILYKHDDNLIRDSVYDLINKLIEKGGKQFWSLEDIVKSNS